MRGQGVFIPTGKRGYWVQLGKPADIRHLLGGGTKFQAPLDTRDEREANERAAPIIANWKRQIEAARAGVTGEPDGEMTRLTDAYRAHRGQPFTEDTARLVLDAMTFALGRIGGLDTQAQRQALLGSAGKPIAVAFQSIASPALARAAAQANEQIMGRATPFLTYLADYEAKTHRKGKTLDQARSDIRQFAAMCKEPIEQLSGKHVQAWLDGLMNKAGEPADAGTKQRKLSSLRGYWEHLRVNEIIDAANDPFAKRLVANRETDSEADDDAIVHYEPAEVPNLWQEAERRGDTTLAHLIRLAAYSGCRLSEVVQLNKDKIITRDGVRCFAVRRGKNKNANRDVPIHSALNELVSELLAASTDGYLIPWEGGDIKYPEKRGADALSKRFGRLKSSLGYDRTYDFHSIRHSVVHLFRLSGCDLEWRHAILGHEPGAGEVSVGANYAANYDTVTKAVWVEKAIRYP